MTAQGQPTYDAPDGEAEPKPVEFLSRENVEKTAQRTYDEFPLPNGMRCRIQSLSELEYAKFETRFCDSKGQPRNDRLKDMRPLLVMMTVVDENGGLRFGPEDLDYLRAMSAPLSMCIYARARKLCGIGEEEEEIDDLKKS